MRRNEDRLMQTQYPDADVRTCEWCDRPIIDNAHPDCCAHLAVELAVGFRGQPDDLDPTRGVCLSCSSEVALTEDDGHARWERA